jgi:hypothetical protein
MQGWVMVTQDGFKSDKELKNWLDQTRKFVETLPVKQKTWFASLTIGMMG